MEKVIRNIEESNNLDFVTKLTALCEIDRLQRAGMCARGCYLGLASAFVWRKSDLGHDFWLDIQNRLLV